MDNRGNLTASLRDLFINLNKSGEGFPPLVFWQVKLSDRKENERVLKKRAFVFVDASSSLPAVLPNWTWWCAYATRC